MIDAQRIGGEIVGSGLLLTVRLIRVVAHAHGIGEHMRDVALLLNALEEMPEWARREHGHIAAIMESLLLVDGSVLNVVGRICGVGPDGGVSARLVVARPISVHEGGVWKLRGVLLESTEAQYWVASRCQPVYGQGAGMPIIGLAQSLTGWRFPRWIGWFRKRLMNRWVDEFDISINEKNRYTLARVNIRWPQRRRTSCTILTARGPM